MGNNTTKLQEVWCLNFKADQALSRVCTLKLVIIHTSYLYEHLENLGPSGLSDKAVVVVSPEHFIAHDLNKKIH